MVSGWNSQAGSAPAARRGCATQVADPSREPGKCEPINLGGGMKVVKRPLRFAEIRSIATDQTRESRLLWDQSLGYKCNVLLHSVAIVDDAIGCNK
eukprot:2610466-Pleurochrysis_carterae.AAC.2